MHPLDNKHKAVRLASRIFATVLFPMGREDWEKARKKTEEVLLILADVLLDEHATSPLEKLKRKKAKLKALREKLKKEKNKP